MCRLNMITAGQARNQDLFPKRNKGVGLCDGNTNALGFFDPAFTAFAELQSVGLIDHQRAVPPVKACVQQEEPIKDVVVGNGAVEIGKTLVEQAGNVLLMQVCQQGIQNC